jgi:hypothetical protein
VFSRTPDLRDAELVLVAELDDHGYVAQIMVLGEQFRTARGLGVGSSLRSVRSAYGKPVLLFGDGSHFALYEFPNGQLSFRLDTDRDLRPPAPDAKVSAVLVIPPRARNRVEGR